MAYSNLFQLSGLKINFLLIKILVLSICSLFWFSTSSAQDSIRIIGNVQNTELKAMPFANVEIIDSKNNQAIKKTITDQSGRFSINVFSTDTVLVRISSLGYKDFVSKVFGRKSEKEIIVSPIILEQGDISLSEVEVSARPPQIVQKNDRITVNLQDNVLASGANVLDVLGRSPGVFVDRDGNITLNNKSGILITINGRQTYMNEEDLTGYLKTIPAENLKNIELITNPPASFDAAGTGGVINLNLKENKEDGLNGTLSAATKYNGGWGYTSSGSLNYKTGKWQSKLGISRNNNFTNVDLDINKLFLTSGSSQTSTMDQKIDWDIRLKTLLIDFGTDYLIKDGHRIGVSYQYAEEDRNDIRNAFTNIFDPNDSESIVSTTVRDHSPGKRHSFDIFYVGNLDTLGSSISGDFTYVRSDRGFNSRFNSNTRNEDSQAEKTEQLFTDNPVKYEVFAGQLDLSKVYKENRTFKAGLKYSSVRSDNNLIMQILQGDSWVSDDDNSYRFLYTEDIAAGYVNYNTPISEKISVNAGIRAEYTDMSGENLTTGFSNDRSYFNLFPSVSIEQKITKNYRVAYNFNRRITRPNYRLLNPFVRYVDPYTIHTGFPQIQPSYTNSFEINNIFKDKYQFALMYSRTTDVFGVVLTQNDTSLVTTYQTRNLDSQTDYGIRGNFPISFTKWWQSDNSAQLSHTSFKSLINGEPLDHGVTTYSIQSQHNISLSNGFRFQIVGSLFGPRLYSLFRQDTQFNLDVGIQKPFFQNKLVLSVNGTDLFKTQYFQGGTRFSNINSREKEYDSNRSIMVSLKYVFSKGKDFSFSKPEKSNEETNRMN